MCIRDLCIIITMNWEVHLHIWMVAHVGLMRLQQDSRYESCYLALLSLISRCAFLWLLPLLYNCFLMYDLFVLLYLVWVVGPSRPDNWWLWSCCNSFQDISDPQAWYYNLVLPPFYFLFSLTFHVTWPYVTWSVTWHLSPDWMITWLSCHMTTPYCSHHLLSYSPLSAIYRDLIVSEPIVSFPIVLPCYCLHLHCSQIPIVCLTRTLSHGSCLSSI